MNVIYDLIFKLNQRYSVSGLESFCDFPLSEYESDPNGNIYLFLKGQKENAKTILFEAHHDVIGFCVKDILPNGFVTLSYCGGIDPTILPGNTFQIHGRSNIMAVAASVPPHLSNVGEKKNNTSLDDIYLDTGFSDVDLLRKTVSIGDRVSFASSCVITEDGRIISSGLDNCAGVSALILAIRKLIEFNRQNNLLFLFSSGEETTSRGVRAICKKFDPDIAFAVDVGFGAIPGESNAKTIEMGRGPSLSYTDTLYHTATDFAVGVARDHNISLQFVAEPRGTGSSATPIQIECGGIPTALISIPLQNMHTPSEIVMKTDIELTAKLICAIAMTEKLPEKEVDLLA